MVIKFKKNDEFKNAKQEFVNALNNAELSEEERTEKLDGYVAALSNAVQDSVLETVSNQHNDQQILASRGQALLTSDEMKFFNAVVEDGLFNDDTLLPVTTIERVFDDLTQEHPLLDAIGVQNLGPVTKIISADPSGLAVWGKIMSGIDGQVNAAIQDEEFIQLKLTAFGVIPDDMLMLGPVWVERYMRTLLVEVLSTGLENGYINGRGPANSEPIGMLKDVSENGAVDDKASSGTLVIADSERGKVIKESLKNVIKSLTKDAKGKKVKVRGNVIIVVNSDDALEIESASTFQTPNGQWVTSLPFGLRIIESDVMPDGQALVVATNRYLAAVGGGYKLRKFDQTLAMEDAHLYTIKTFAYGTPLDNKAAALYDLSFEAPEPEETPAG